MAAAILIFQVSDWKKINPPKDEARNCLMIFLVIPFSKSGILDLLSDALFFK